MLHLMAQTTIELWLKKNKKNFCKEMNAFIQQGCIKFVKSYSKDI